MTSLFDQIWSIFIPILSLVQEFFNMQETSKLLLCGRTADACLLPVTSYAIVPLQHRKGDWLPKSSKVSKRQRYQRQSQCPHTVYDAVHFAFLVLTSYSSSSLTSGVQSSLKPWYPGAQLSKVNSVPTISPQSWCIQLQAYFAQENDDYAIIGTNFGGRNIDGLLSKPPIHQINSSPKFLATWYLVSGGAPSNIHSIPSG